MFWEFEFRHGEAGLNRQVGESGLLRQAFHFENDSLEDLQCVDPLK